MSREERPESPFERNDANCQKLIDEFVAFTDTNEALAMMLLQQFNWQMEPAINEFYDVYGEVPRSLLQHRAVKKNKEKTDQVTIVELNSDEDENREDREKEDQKVKEGKANSKEKEKEEDREEEQQKQQQQQQTSNEQAGPSSSKKQKTADARSSRGEGASHSTQVGPGPPPSSSLKSTKELVFVTWNIDGLDEKNLALRTEAVGKIINQASAHVVFFQEVVPQSEALLKKSLQGYTFISGREWKGFNANYYVMTALRKDSVGLISHQTVDFENSIMTRNMLTSRIEIGGVVVNLGNTHLESTVDHAQERMNQMRRVLRHLNQIPLNEPFILAGDLNTRDKEVTSIGGLPNGVIDVWEATGKKPECAFTWDMLRNDNLTINSKFKPRCRFDRIWVRDSKPSHLIPTSFNLVGIERLKPHVCFPSDHWGLLSVMKLFK